MKDADAAFADNTLCSCREGNEPCASCRFCLARNTPDGRKALCERIVHFLVFQPFYQMAIARAVTALFPDKIIYEDDKDICAMLFEAVLFEDKSAVETPFSYFVENAPLSADERRLYEAWRQQTRYEFFAVEKIIPGKEIHAADLAGKNRYRIYETKGTATMKEGSVIIARIVPFLSGWMITTETVISYASASLREQLRPGYGIPIQQFVAVQRYHEDRKRRRGD